MAVPLSDFSERKAVVIFGYEHMPPEISLEVAVESFEVIVEEVCQIELGPRVESRGTDLIHPVQQQARVYGWEVIQQADA